MERKIETAKTINDKADSVLNVLKRELGKHGKTIEWVMESLDKKY